MELSRNIVSTYHPLHPEITKANIASQFKQDEVQLPNLEELQKAEFNTKERKKLAKEGEAKKDGSFPIRNAKDLKNAIHDVGRANNPAGAKSWIKKRAKALDLEHLLPEEWHKGEEDELEKGEKGEGSKGGKVIGHTTSGKPVYAHKGATHEDHAKFDSEDHADAADLHEKYAQSIHKQRMSNKTSAHGAERLSQMYESSRSKAKEHAKRSGELFNQENKTDVEKAFNDLMDNNDPISKAFENILNK